MDTTRPQRKRGPGIPGTGIWKKKCGWWASSTAGGRWRQQHKTELGGVGSGGL